ncbi:1-acyl-sn-glycerol-3-phosphate acyltransferase 2 [Porphyridium purpureum]|uniref:1-acyl-sn-glycerol-3-phosphate acyltransferase 2 n=1 Tax=Porphyridium purpureum TaxID=35688 RepID=A0A5J4YVE4_PORPP|nr:1-acyl-sn-glycerol-3-phosphate acyltransferase 2 [Porphyridium purpureum]|eukprot:POR7699..scf209_3
MHRWKTVGKARKRSRTSNHVPVDVRLARAVHSSPTHREFPLLIRGLATAFSRYTFSDGDDALRTSAECTSACGTLAVPPALADRWGSIRSRAAVRNGWTGSPLVREPCWSAPVRMHASVAALRAGAFVLVVFVCGIWVALAQICVRVIVSRALGYHRRARQWNRDIADCFFSLAPYLLSRWSALKVRAFVPIDSGPGDGDQFTGNAQQATEATADDANAEFQPRPKLARLSDLNGCSFLGVCNHQGDLDWLIAMALAHQCGYPMAGSLKCVVKRSLQYVPVIGQIFAALDFVFLERRWETDRARLMKWCENMRDYPPPLWLGLYPEGTRMSSEKLALSQAFCRERGLPVLQNLLYPRFKAFNVLLDGLRTQVTGVLDITVWLEESYSLQQVLSGSYEGEILIFVTKTDAVSIDDSEEWLANVWQKKDILLGRLQTAPGRREALQEWQEVSEPIPDFHSLLAFLSLVIPLTCVICYVILQYRVVLMLGGALLVAFVVAMTMMQMKPSHS